MFRWVSHPCLLAPTALAPLFMRRLLSTLLILSLSVLTAGGAMSATAQPTEGREAAGLIIVFKDDVIAVAKPVGEGPWANDRDRARAQWDGQARKGRERLARLKKEAGLPDATPGEAGNAGLLRFARPLRGQALENAVRRARLHPDVAWVEPDVLVPRLAPLFPNDTDFVQQWHLHAPDPLINVSSLNLPTTWGDTTGSTSGPTAVVAVVDSGIRPNHPDLLGKLLPGYDLVSDLSVANDGNGRDADPTDPGDWVDASDKTNPLFATCDVANSSWHGTFIAGQIAAATDNAQGVAGINWGARVLPVRVSGKCGALLSDLLDGLRWAAGLPVAGLPANPHPARVINLSFGGDKACDGIYQTTINAVTDQGSLVVVAGGNLDTTLTRPADCRRVMAVASVRRDGAKAGYSNFGSRIALAAPGGSTEGGSMTMLRSTVNKGATSPLLDDYDYKQGTSFAAPQAAGVASLMLAVNPSLSPRQLIERMKVGARPHVTVAGFPACGTPGVGVCNCTTTTCGTGLLDARTSVQLATGPAVVIKPLNDVEPGTVITLDGQQSVAIPGASIVSWQWTQVSGPPVTISSANSAVATATLVSENSYVFSLTVVDNFGRSGEDTVRGVAAMPPPAGGGGGGGSAGQLWGASLWAGVVAVALDQRRRRKA